MLNMEKDMDEIRQLRAAVWMVGNMDTEYVFRDHADAVAFQLAWS
jgi:hypothetical protein